MAKRKRLTPALLGPAPGYEIGAEGDDVVETGGGDAAPEMKSFLRPRGAPAGVAPPIARVAGDAATQAALAELSEAMTAAREEGRLVLRLALDAVEAEHLVRDRITLDAEELDGLVASIREHGQRTPIEVTELAPGRYGLISGWRRMQALRRLSGGDVRFGQVLALVRRPESAAAAYVAMVEENEIRAGLSYYERARIAGRAVELGVFATEKQALQQLFAHASRARRSKIGSFLAIWRALDASLRFPAAIPERLGLALEKALELDPGRNAAFAGALAADPAPDAASELARLQEFAAGKVDGKPETAKPATENPAETSPGENVSRAKQSAPEPQGHEVRPGVFLEISGGFTKPVLTLFGPGVGPDFRERLEHWLATGH